MEWYNDHVALVAKTIASNIWLLEDKDGHRYLIDTGVLPERWLIFRNLRAAGIQGPGDIDAIILTHRHGDHAGNAQWLKDRFSCPLFCHRLDAPFLLGRAKPAKLSRGLGRKHEEFFCTMEDLLPTRAEVDDVYDIGPWKFGFHVYQAFGHTEGSCMLYHADTKTLFSGDALLSGIPPFRCIERLGLSMLPYSIDNERCHRLTLEFLENPPEVTTLCSGHGPVVVHKARQKMIDFGARMNKRHMDEVG